MFMSSYLWVQKKLPGWFVAECPLLDTRMMVEGCFCRLFFHIFHYIFFIYWMMNENYLTGEYLCKFHLHGVINLMCLSRITQVLVTDHRSSLNDLSD